jgi:outer membrane protein
MKKIYSLAAAVLLSVSGYATSAVQDNVPWTLRRCIDYAIDNNISLKQQEIQVKQQEIQLNTSMNSRLPDLSASASENFSFGRGLTADNTYSNTNTTSTGFSLGTSVPVFQGLRIRNSIKSGELNLKAVTADLEKAKDDIRVAVAQAYVQILYNMEILDVARNQVMIDSLQVVRLSEMESNGKASRVEVAQQKAALGQSRLSETQAGNNLNLSVLDLTQLLEITDPAGFSIVRPEVGVESIPLGDPEEIYARAVAFKPSVQAETYRLQATDFSIKYAKGARMPSISASGGIGTNYYTMSNGASDTFAAQIRNNFSQYLGLSLNIPIFSGFQTRNQIRQAELEQDNQKLQVESVKKSLYKEIQQAYCNAVAAAAKFRSSQDAGASAEESFELVKAKYENGKANITEFNESRDGYLEAQSNLAQARYEYLFTARLLDFYRTGELTL